MQPKFTRVEGVGIVMQSSGVLVRQVCGVEVWRGGLGGAYLLPTLLSVGASLVPPCFRSSDHFRYKRKPIVNR